MSGKRIAIVAILVASLIVASVAAVMFFKNYLNGNTYDIQLTKDKTIPSKGTFKLLFVGVYWDSAATNATTLIDWGILSPNDTKTVTLYVKNEGNGDGHFTFATSNWNPVNATTFIFATWNYNGAIVPKNTVVPIIFKIQISSAIQGIDSFTYDTLITAVV